MFVAPFSGDQLLPLEQVEEVCPYPSLEEASAMATDSLLLAHANRPNSIPESSKLAHDTKAIEQIEFDDDFDASCLDQDFNYADNHYKENVEDQEKNTMAISENNIKQSEINIKDVEDKEVEDTTNENETINAASKKSLDSKIESKTLTRHVIPEAILSQLLPSKDEKEEIKPLYDLKADGSLIGNFLLYHCTIR